jgi:FkbM family methyltransferase
MWTSPLLLHARRLGRRLGLNSWIARCLQSQRSEDAFAVALRSCIRPGDTVWDVGANVGVYTADYAALVGQHGLVVAFEPSPACFAELERKFAHQKTVILQNVALGNFDGLVYLEIDDDPLSTACRIPGEHEYRIACNTQDVLAQQADSLIAAKPEFLPNVMKVDVEGHEGAVIEGARRLLQNDRLRCIGVEVHFTILEKRGEGRVAAQLETEFRRNGFAVAWADGSHLLARR